MMVSISKSTNCHDREALSQYTCAFSCVMWCNSSVRGISLVQFFLFMQHLLWWINVIFFISRGDHTSVDFYMAVVPPKTECVVFSIDGSFTASMSVTGRDPKVRAGAVDIVRWVLVSSGVFIGVYFGGTSCQFFVSFELLFSYHVTSNITVISFI
jgi:hypothetical protein